MSGIILPRIHRAEFFGFQPLFDKPVTLELPVGPFLILGGNAMGKTTMLQAIVFAIAGPAGSEIEQETAYQWETDYFAPRLADVKNAIVMVEFSFGKTRLAIKRNLASDAIIAFRVGRGGWEQDSNRAAAKYEQIVLSDGNYPSFDEFRYLIHRLCYLAENRRNLLWDTAAQVRVAMLVCGDAAGESTFRSTRAELQKTDTEKRHLHVDIGRLQARITRLRGKQPQAKDVEPQAESSMEQLLKEASALQLQLDRIGTSRTKEWRKLKHSRQALSTLNTELEEQQGKLSSKEDAYVLQTLREVENGTSALALHKLLVHHRCPYCAQESISLAKFARRAVADGKCPICGQTHVAVASPGDLAELRSAIIANTRRRTKLEKECSISESALFDLEQQDISVRARLSEITPKLPRIPKEDELEINTSDLASLEATLKMYEAKHLQLESQCADLRKSVEDQFAEFTASCARRLQQLQEVASEYGHEFLGDPCEFVAIPAPGEISAFKFFVPKFAGAERRKPESCSESERFFLDIAFRMALLDLAGVLSNTRGTFICETPENALDLAYTDNVAEMFSKFALRDFSVLLTANIQIGGVAKPLLAKYPPSERRKRVFNLMESGVSTDVQARKKKEFANEFKKIIGQK